RFHYSNLGFGLLGEVVARLRGTSWDDAVRVEVLDPLGMRRTTPRPAGRAADGCAVHPLADVVLAEPAPLACGLAAAGPLWARPGPARLRPARRPAPARAAGGRRVGSVALTGAVGPARRVVLGPRPAGVARGGRRAVAPRPAARPARTGQPVHPAGRRRVGGPR